VTIDGLVQIRVATLHQLVTPEGERGLMISFFPKPGQAQTQPLNIALTELQAKEMAATITRAISELPKGPGSLPAAN
jgi:hypothetical protein